MYLNNSLPEGLTIKCHGLIQLPDILFYIEGRGDLKEMSYLEFTRLLQVFLYPDGCATTFDGLWLEMTGGNSHFVRIGEADTNPFMKIEVDDFIVVAKYVFRNTPIVKCKFPEGYDKIHLPEPIPALEPRADERLEFLRWLEDQPRPEKFFEWDDKRGELYDFLRGLTVVDDVFKVYIDGEEKPLPGLV